MKRLSTKEVAKLLGKSERTVRALAKEGIIPALIIGGNGKNSFFFYEELLREKGLIK